MTQRVELRPPGAETEPVSVLLTHVDYDQYGLPVFENVLDRRPSKEGEQYTVVHYENNRPVRSYDIAVTGQDRDLLRPFKVVYEWTGRGFRGGILWAANILKASSPVTDTEEAEGLMLSSAATVVVGTAGGFVVGLAASLPPAGEELKLLVLNKKETLVGLASYDYDRLGRLRCMRMFAPGEPLAELVRTEFFYKDSVSVPFKTEVTSYPEGSVRTIQ